MPPPYNCEKMRVCVENLTLLQFFFAADYYTFPLPPRSRCCSISGCTKTGNDVKNNGHVLQENNVWIMAPVCLFHRVRGNEQWKVSVKYKPYNISDLSCS